MELYEGSAKQVKVIYPGRFQPPHKGHAKVYEYLCQKFGTDNVYVVTSDKVEMPKSPFNFAEKAKMWALTGVNTDRVLMDPQPYRAQGVVSQWDATNTILLFAVSEKDMAEDPRFSFKPKKDGSPSYFQQFTNLKQCETLDKHAYMMTVPTFDFTVLGKPANSATQIRAQFDEADLATQRQIVTDLFGKFDNNVFNIMKARLEGQAVAEGLSTKPAKKGSQRWLTAQKRKEYEKKHPPIEPADQMYGTAKILPKKTEEGRLPQLPVTGADYSKFDTEHLKSMLRPGVMHRNELKFKTLIRRELKKRETQQVTELSPATHAAHAAKRGPQVIPTLMKDIRKGAKMGRAVGKSLAKVKAATPPQQDNIFEETNAEEMKRLVQQLRKAADRRDYNSMDAIKLNIRKLKGEMELRAANQKALAQSQRVFSESGLDAKTLSPKALADLHKVPTREIIEQLKKGIKIEQEHTSDKKVATEIALDHLKEDPGYYDKLAKVEESKLVEGLYGVPVEYGPTAADTKRYEVRANSPEEACRIAVAKFRKAFPNANPYASSESVVQLDEGVSEQNLDNPDPKISSLAKAAVKMKQQLADLTGQITEATNQASSDDILWELTRSYNVIMNSDAYSLEGKSTIRFLYYHLRSSLMADNMEEFGKAWDYGLRKHPDAMAELCDTVAPLYVGDEITEGWVKKTAAGIGAAAAIGLGGVGLYNLDQTLQHQEQQFVSQITDPADLAMYNKSREKYTNAAAMRSMSSTYKTMADMEAIRHARVRDKLKDKYDIVTEGAKVDRMVGHIKASEKKLGKSPKEAENIAWATANKRGFLDNKNKKTEAIVPGFGEMRPEQVKKEVAELTAEMLKYAREGNMRAVGEYMDKLEPFVRVARREITESFDKAMRTVRRNAI